MKIAVPVEGENLTIFKRTGRAPYFAIFEFDGNDIKFLELRENPHAKEHHHHHHKEAHTDEEINHHQKHLREINLGECKYLVCPMLGPNMRDAVKNEGIEAIIIKGIDGKNALEVLKEVKDSLK